jgi:hypothetical protein
MTYLISGLGADYRAFARLDLGNVRVTHIHSITPPQSPTDRDKFLSTYLSTTIGCITNDE